MASDPIPANRGQKRKEPPNQSSKASTTKRARPGNGYRRDIPAQQPIAGLDKATGALDVAKFVSAREFEIRALEKSMQRDRQGLSQRAFQQVPINMRRRGASHNAKKVPKRLRKRAEREMKEDNTPTVNQKTRPKSRIRRIRMEKAKTLKGLNALLRVEKIQKKAKQTDAVDPTSEASISRAPKIKDNALTEPPKAASRFKKRQLHKTWLPTHLWHAKRAHMTRPAEPLWRMAIPLRPTEKSYRPTHRAGGARGAIAWDISYVSTIGCSGPEKALTSMLAALGLDSDYRTDLWKRIAPKWRKGTRSMTNWLRDDVGHGEGIAPVTVLWCATKEGPHVDVEGALKEDHDVDRQLFVRVHPSAFLQVWNKIMEVAKKQSPVVKVQDLRFEIGSLEITGPASTEALEGVLKPTCDGTHDRIWQTMGGLNNAASVPLNAILAFNAFDPRLQNPPGKGTSSAVGPDKEAELAEILCTWPPDQTPEASGLFHRENRYAATQSLPSQKSISRRRTLAPPGQPLAPKATDPRIPVMVLASRSCMSDTNGQGTWTVLLPWKCVDIVWRRLLFYPLSSGRMSMFGGLQQHQQVAFERQSAWFPGDFPATEAGKAWWRTEDEHRKHDWERKPPGRRTNFEALALGNGETQELGKGWAADWEFLRACEKDNQTSTEHVSEFSHISPSLPTSPSFGRLPSTVGNGGYSLLTVRLVYLTRGTPLPVARIYSLPSESENKALRQEWLDLGNALSATGTQSSKLKKDKLNHWGDVRKHRVYEAENIKDYPVPGYDPAWDEEKKPKPKSKANHSVQDAQPTIPPSLLNNENSNTDTHPPCPSKQNLIGFVTSGSYNLAQGRGTAIGSIWIQKLQRQYAKEDEAMKEGGTGVSSSRIKQMDRERRLVIVRNAGETVGRLASWEPV